MLARFRVAMNRILPRIFGTSFLWRPPNVLFPHEAANPFYLFYGGRLRHHNRFSNVPCLLPYAGDFAQPRSCRTIGFPMLVKSKDLTPMCGSLLRPRNPLRHSYISLALNRSEVWYGPICYLQCCSNSLRASSSPNSLALAQSKQAPSLSPSILLLARPRFLYASASSGSSSIAFV